MAKITDIFNLSGKTAIVTGGYGHLGKGMVNVLLSCDANVIVAGRNKEKFTNTFATYSGNNLHFHEIDIMSSESIEKCFADVHEKFGTIDILINNAHTAKGSGADDISSDDWAYTMDGVLGSVYKSIKTVMPYMKKQRSGKIINISSMYGVVSPDLGIYEGDDCEKYLNPPHYGAAKAGMIQLTKYYAVYLGKFNIQVNCLTPGPFPKEQIQKDNPEFIDRLKQKNPLNKIGVPENLAGPVVLLSSQASDFMTGQNIIVDGGWTIW